MLGQIAAAMYQRFGKVRRYGGGKGTSRYSYEANGTVPEVWWWCRCGGVVRWWCEVCAV